MFYFIGYVRSDLYSEKAADRVARVGRGGSDDHDTHCLPY